MSDFYSKEGVSQLVKLAPQKEELLFDNGVNAISLTDFAIQIKQIKENIDLILEALNKAGIP